MPNILALDISSTAIGWCYLQDDRVLRDAEYLAPGYVALGIRVLK